MRGSRRSWCVSPTCMAKRPANGFLKPDSASSIVISARYFPTSTRHRIGSSSGLPEPRGSARPAATPLWRGRVHGELLKLGMDVGQTETPSITRLENVPYQSRRRDRLDRPVRGPTLSFRLLYGLLVLRHDKRRILWLGVTAHPSADWIARQITEACGWEDAPQYLIRDRDRVYGEVFTRRLRAMGIRDRPTAPRSAWQNGYVERLIGSIRRECLDHLVVLGERHLRDVIRTYAGYYNAGRLDGSGHRCILD